MDETQEESVRVSMCKESDLVARKLVKSTFGHIALAHALIQKRR